PRSIVRPGHECERPPMPSDLAKPRGVELVDEQPVDPERPRVRVEAWGGTPPEDAPPSPPIADPCVALPCEDERGGKFVGKFVGAKTSRDGRWGGGRYWLVGHR